jgi:predicted oxidoreductase (fatty acid repression mutant protein)
VADLNDATELQNRWSALEQRAIGASLSADVRALVKSESAQFVNWLNARRGSVTSHLWDQLDQIALGEWSNRYNAALAAVREQLPTIDVQAYRPPTGTVVEAVTDAADSLGSGIGLVALALLAIVAMKGRK